MKILLGFVFVGNLNFYGSYFKRRRNGQKRGSGTGKICEKQAEDPYSIEKMDMGQPDFSISGVSSNRTTGTMSNHPHSTHLHTVNVSRWTFA
jgi:hypothetical protein